jgi:hypothetical protein
MKVTQTHPSKIIFHSMFVEMELQSQLRDRNRRSVIPEWEVIFYPDDVKQEHTFDSTDDFKLSDAQLLGYAKMVSKLRHHVRLEALQLINSQSQDG